MKNEKQTIEEKRESVEAMLSAHLDMVHTAERLHEDLLSKINETKKIADDSCKEETRR